MKNIPVILLGCGGVGRHLLQHIVSCRSLHAKLGVRLRVVGVSDSKSLLLASDVFTRELGDTFLDEVSRVKLGGSSLKTFSSFVNECQVFTNSEATRTVIDIATHLSKSTGLVVVDCSASSETMGVLNQVVDLGCCIVLANKKPLTAAMEDYDKLVAHPRCIRYESTRPILGNTAALNHDEAFCALELVGAGLPVIASLNRILSSGDPIHCIVACLSGTLGYVMSEVEGGKPFSQVVKDAKNLGYTEPDPRDDLSGMDVARKALILSRLLGRRVNLDSLKIESLYPEEMGPNMMSLEDFLSSGLLLLDNDIQERVQKASLDGKVLRYVCVIEGPRTEVGLRELPKDSPLGRLRGSNNILTIYSRCYNEQPLVIEGAGAGNDTTAAGVLADILDIQDLFA